ncbi:protein FAR-RED IMPAIRED RESPONSE 1-like [Asparagus officinalis]|uniref:protein FAR-RED IMPAIRED RESPONSE 1-like n=1 Tax=Asparagus officinalis TaxID=4686 RepID=UPI00098E7162|nr:protein FAR-RED IMPAIRED RESPONSE 1-like [Asparagus officinalis]
MVNIPQHQQFSLLRVQSGCIENIGCTQRDLYNHARDISADLKGHDDEMFYEYLKLEQGKNPSFTFQIEADEEQKITHCFWSDARSGRAYKFFGDVVIFDTTYNTNRYGLIFTPIMGVNNHGQTIVFACGFLNHESVDDFVWLFNQFLASMPGGATKMIITDQDPSMTKAFPLVLPNTFHRYCSWHILMKFSEKINAVKYSIYKNMSSSQRAESGHAFFKKFVSKNNSLVDFMIQFGRGLVRQRHEELMADHKDLIEKPKLRINHDFLEQMVDIYTNEMYYKFEAEVCDSFNYKFCKKFESAGIICTHIISYLMKFDAEILPDKYILMMKFDAEILPDKYILKRWTKSAKLGTMVDDKETRKMFTDGVRIINEQIDQFISSHMDKLSFACCKGRVNVAVGHPIPENFEEQMKLATAAAKAIMFMYV